MRRNEGFEITDRIELTLGGAEALLEAAREHAAYIAAETLAVGVSYDGDRAAWAAHVTIDGGELAIAVTRATGAQHPA